MMDKLELPLFEFGQEYGEIQLNELLSKSKDSNSISTNGELYIFIYNAFDFFWKGENDISITCYLDNVIEDDIEPHFFIKNIKKEWLYLGTGRIWMYTAPKTSETFPFSLKIGGLKLKEHLREEMLLNVYRFKPFFLAGCDIKEVHSISSIKSRINEIRKRNRDKFNLIANNKIFSYNGYEERVTMDYNYINKDGEKLNYRAMDESEKDIMVQTPEDLEIETYCPCCGNDDWLYYVNTISKDLAIQLLKNFVEYNNIDKNYFIAV